MVQPIVLHDYVSQTRAAKLLGISRMCLWNWLRDGKVQAVIVGEYRMIPQSEVDRLKREMTEAVESE